MNRLRAPELPDWLASQIPFERYMVEVGDGLRMHVMEQGEGRPVLLFHGLPTWGYLYRKVAAELAGEPFRLIMPDLMGLGFSDRPLVADQTLRNHSRWMASFVEQSGIAGAVAVVQDWGGPVGMHALSTIPGVMRSLVVMNTSLGPPKEGFKPTLFHRFFSSSAGALTTRYLGLPQRSLGRAQGDRSSISGEVARAYRYPLAGREATASVSAIIRMTPDSLAHPTVEPLREVADFVEGFGGPAAIVWGDRDPVLGRLRNRISRMLPQAEVIATDAGHFLQEEVPAEIAAAIRSVS